MPRILIVNDEPDLIEVCRWALEDEGYEVHTIERPNPKTFGEEVEGVRPDAVLLDLVMPGTSGEELAPILKQLPHGRKARLVVMSALGDGRDRAAHLGAAAFVAKPFSRETLIGTIADSLRVQNDDSLRAG